MYYKMTCTNNKKKYPTIADYLSVIDICNKYGAKVQEYRFEFGDDGKLHIHGLIEARANFYVKKVYNLLKPLGYHFLMEKFKKETPADLNGWLRYIREDKEIIQAQLVLYYRKIVKRQTADELDQYLASEVQEADIWTTEMMQMAIDEHLEQESYAEAMKKQVTLDLDLEYDTTGD